MEEPLTKIVLNSYSYFIEEKEEDVPDYYEVQYRFDAYDENDKIAWHSNLISFYLDDERSDVREFSFEAAHMEIEVEGDDILNIDINEEHAIYDDEDMFLIQFFTDIDLIN